MFLLCVVKSSIFAMETQRIHVPVHPGAAVAKVQVQAGSGTPVLRPSKPKVYLTCETTIPPKTWVKL